MKRLIAILLVVGLLVSVLSTDGFAVEESIRKMTVPVEYTDAVGNFEQLSIATDGSKVWVNANQLFNRLGFSVADSNSESGVVISNSEFNELPYQLTMFHYDSCSVAHNYFNRVYEDYTAPFESFKDSEGIWVPLQYSLNICGGSVEIIGDTIQISVPRRNLLDLFYQIASNRQDFMFNWGKDLGYNTSNSFLGHSTDEWMYGLNYTTVLFDGILDFDGSAWATFFTQFAGKSTGFDVKYGDKLAMLICTNSSKELEAAAEEVEKLYDILDENGALGQLFSTISETNEFNLDTLKQSCDTLLAQIEDDNPASVLAYNREYARLEKMLGNQDSFRQVGDTLHSVQEGVSNALPYAEVGLYALKTCGYLSEFQKQDTYALEAFEQYIDGEPQEYSMPEPLVWAMRKEKDQLKSNIVEYAVSRFIINDLPELCIDKMKLTKVLGSQANVALLAWDLASGFIPFVSDGLKSADYFVLAEYARLIQEDAFNKYFTLRESTIDIDSTDEELQNCALACYMYLKSCYLTRDAAVASLCNVVDVENSTEPLIVEQKEINNRIAHYMAELKTLSGEKTGFGFRKNDEKNSYAETMDSSIIEFSDSLQSREEKDSTHESAEEQTTDNSEIERLRQDIIGQWGQEGDVAAWQYFYEDGTYKNVYGYGEGTYYIEGDRTLVIDLPWGRLASTDRYYWFEGSFEEFHSKTVHDGEHFWSFNRKNELIMDGTKYYRDGIADHRQTEGNLMAVLVGSWVDSFDSFCTEFRIISDGTYEENALLTDGRGTVFSREPTGSSAGTVEITGADTLKLWQSVSGFGAIPIVTSLEYDSGNDTLVDIYGTVYYRFVEQ